MNRYSKGSVEGPPQGTGHYSDDGSWWWDDGREGWFRTTADEDVLEIEVEDYGSTSWVRRIATSLGTQSGISPFRFVGRARSSDPRWPAYAFPSDTFPALPWAPLDDLEAQGAWVPEIKASLEGLERELVERGWRPMGSGGHWWSKIYRRPVVDWERAPDHTPAG